MKNTILSILLFFPLACFSADNSFERNPFTAAPLTTTALNPNADGKLSLNFDEIKIRDLLQLLAEYAHENIIISDSIQGGVALHLQNVTWQQALNTVMVMANLSKREQDGVIFITPINTQDSNANIASSSEFIKIQYANATDIATLLKNQTGSLLSEDGSVSADPRTNSLWIQDTPEKIATVRNFIQRLDVPVKQVLIKARIVNVDASCLQELGVKFGTVNTHDSLNLDGLAMDMPVAVTQDGRFNIAIAKLGSNTLLDVELSALESEGHGKIISSPELTTADRTPAYIEAGEEIPYQEQTPTGATNVAFKKAVLGLKVTPQITPHGKIILNLTVNQDKLSSVNVHGEPAIQTREVGTQVEVADGQTLVLGGIYEQTDSVGVERIPFLGSLPVVGILFRNKITQSDRRELLIFVTPQIINE
jgi:type IV pilus assembly protein PilQ